ncbi:UTRA domain-containing protein [Hyphococcus formosus]|uniref:UTRA domain-containing protein n=1 Tax=Hyphococcus formosus TaxID=3143534 RepID=UPI00398A5E0B
MNVINHHSIRKAIRQRIESGEWQPGTIIPAEADLAAEYGCSRTTVNRAMQNLADDGLIERKRRAGTRVKEIPTRQTTFKIPIVRHEIEATGANYRPHILLKETKRAPDHITAKLHLDQGEKLFHLVTAHLSDRRVYAVEDRWVNLAAAPEIISAPLDEISANEWLIRKVPYSNGDVVFSASAASKREAEAFEIDIGAALFTVDRTTWLDDIFITTMTLRYRPGYQLNARL